jgi:hypothetical protein
MLPKLMLACREPPRAKTSVTTKPLTWLPSPYSEKDELSAKQHKSKLRTVIEIAVLAVAAGGSAVIDGVVAEHAAGSGAGLEVVRRLRAAAGAPD